MSFPRLRTPINSAAGLLLSCWLGGTAQAQAQANEVVVNPGQTALKPPQVATAKPPPPDAAHFALAARITLSQGMVRQVAWLDEQRFIVQNLTPDSAQVLALDYASLAREVFLSAEFVEQHLSGHAAADRLDWHISPARKYLFFTWTTQAGARRHRLVDISAPPSFRLRGFTPPEGMQIERALFSPDDRYLCLFHDSHLEGSPVSVLVLDLETGAEAWRIGSTELAFIQDCWWDGAIYDSPRFQCTAQLHGGQLLAQPGLATCDVAAREVRFDANRDGVVTGASGVWGQVTAVRTGSTRQPFRLLVSRDDKRDQIPLSSVPDRLQLLAEPGLLLLQNRDEAASELWLIDVLAGTKHMVDGDCGSFALSSAGRLIVRAEQSNELRFYDFVNPRRPGPPADDSGAPRDPDAWIPH